MVPRISHSTRPLWYEASQAEGLCHGALSCEPVSTYSIGVDLGGTNLRAAAFDASGKLLAKVSGSTPIEEGPDAVVADIARAVDHLREQFGPANLAGIGAGVPGNILMD